LNSLAVLIHASAENIVPSNSIEARLTGLKSQRIVLKDSLNYMIDHTTNKDNTQHKEQYHHKGRDRIKDFSFHSVVNLGLNISSGCNYPERIASN